MSAPCKRKSWRNATPAASKDRRPFVLQGPEIRTGFLQKPDEPLKFKTGDEVTITTDYEYKGDKDMIAMR